MRVRFSDKEGLDYAIKFLIVVVLLSYLIIPIERQLYFGYWFSPPTLFGELNDIDEMLGISEYRVDAGELDMKDYREDLSIWNDRILYRQEKQYLLTDRVLNMSLKAPDLPPALINSVTNKVATECWWPNDKLKSRPFYVLAVLYRKGADKYVLASHSTSEYGSDSYGYAETIFEYDGLNLRKLREIHYVYEVAGLEDATVYHVWLLNIGALSFTAIMANGLVQTIKHIVSKQAGR